MDIAGANAVRPFFIISNVKNAQKSKVYFVQKRVDKKSG